LFSLLPGDGPLLGPGSGAGAPAAAWGRPGAAAAARRAAVRGRAASAATTVTAAGTGAASARVAPATAIAATSSAFAVAATTTTFASSAALAAGHLHAHTLPAKSGSVHAPHGVLGIPGILKLDEGETGRVPCDPDVLQGSVLGEGVLQLVLVGVVAHVADVNLAGNVPITMARHDEFCGAASW